MSNRLYMKHLVECKCILKLFEGVTPPKYHKFVVFSEVEDPIVSSTNIEILRDLLEATVGKVIPSYAQCNNCGVIHHVTEANTSTILPKEEMRSMPTIDEIEMELPPKVASVLRSNECELHVWQEARHILTNQLWNSFVILAKEKAPNGVVTGKALLILGESLFKIETFELSDEASPQ